MPQNSAQHSRYFINSNNFFINFQDFFLDLPSCLYCLESGWHDFESNPYVFLSGSHFPFCSFASKILSFPLLSFSFFYRLFGSHVCLKVFYYPYFFTIYMCVSMRTPGCYSTCGGPRTTCRGQFSLPPCG